VGSTWQKGISIERKTEENNKELVLEAFDALFNRRDYVAAERYWSPHNIQHSAQIEPGREPVHLACGDKDPAAGSLPINAHRAMRSSGPAFRCGRSRHADLSGQFLPDPLWWRGESVKTTHDHSAQ